MSGNVHTYDTPADLIEAACERTAAAMERAMLSTGWCMWAISGGSTPRAAFERLAAEPYRSGIAWNRVHVFWVDERVVPADHPDSNYGMAHEALLDRLDDLPEANVHRVRTEVGAEGAADDYAATLASLFDDDPPRFDLVWLGMGADGHTASLFPGTGATEIVDRAVAAVHVPQLDAWRVTLTLPVLNAARETLVLVTGEGKAETVARVLNADEPTPELPISLVRPDDSELHWLLDAAAAAKLA